MKKWFNILPSFIHTLVWTPCLMHRCVCIWIYVGFVVDIDIKILGVPPQMMPSINGWMTGRMDERVTWCHLWMDDGTDGWTGHMMPSMDGWRDGWMDGSRDAIHGWMTGWMDGRVTWCHPWMDGWMDRRVTWKSFMKNDHDLFYYLLLYINIDKLYNHLLT